ncbi:MAG: cobalamin-dependent protein [bacterium]|nr:cobalamin-dependent protein [bacterium]
MSELTETLAVCIERGKINQAASYPPDLRGKEGADEIARNALAAGETADAILQGCMAGMSRIGEKFAQNKVFVPDLLMAAKAMNAAMAHLKPYFKSGAVRHKGRFVIGTVAGDLHDIGKNLVAMVVEGGGWEVVDLGVDVPPEKFADAVKANPGCVVGLSALLTTTMVNMEKTVQLIKAGDPKTTVLVGGAPVTQAFADQIGADGYSSDPQGAVKLLEAKAA